MAAYEHRAVWATDATTHRNIHDYITDYIHDIFPRAGYEALMLSKTDSPDYDSEVVPPTSRSRRPQRSLARRRAYIGVCVGVASVIVVAVLLALIGPLGSDSPTLVYYVANRANLPLTVTEQGNLESQDEVKVICEVDDVEGDNVRGAQVQYVVPNGSVVREGELLVEFNDSGYVERLDRQILAAAAAKSTQISARVTHENQITQNKTSEDEARLQVRLANLALEEFNDAEGGTFQINLQDVELAIQEAQAIRLIQQSNLEGVERLHDLGYRSVGELATARLSALKSERALASALSKKKKLVGYQYKKTKLELEGQLESARRLLEQVIRDNAALLEQARAAMEAADASAEKEDERLQRYKAYVENCKIYAPQSGMVAYHVCRYHPGVRVGATVNLRDHILSLPNLKRMQVKTKIHESVLDKVCPGLPVTVRLDAFPDRSYDGEVQFVSVLPDTGEKAKVYTTLVTILEDVEHLRPGMTAVCEIHVDLLRDVISVPVQAIQQIRHDSWCYVDNGRGVERRLVKIGATNEKFVEIRDGLVEGDRVVLNPDALFENDAASDGTITPDRDVPENMDIERIDAARSAHQEAQGSATGAELPAANDATGRLGSGGNEKRAVSPRPPTSKSGTNSRSGKASP